MPIPDAVRYLYTDVPKAKIDPEETTIFLTTHYMDEAEYLCDRVGIIDRGKILVIDSISNLKSAVGKVANTFGDAKSKVGFIYVVIYMIDRAW